MKIELSFAELHSPLFLNGKNFTTKILPSRTPGVSLTYDRDNRELHVVYMGHAAIVPIEAVASMCPIDPVAAGVTMKVEKVAFKNPEPPAKPVKAQVSAPNGIKI